MTTPNATACTTPALSDRIAGGLVGLLVGDALGVPYEFTAPRDVPPPASIEMEPPPGFRRAHRGIPAGTWSDDGAQALCLLATLVECGELDLADFGRRLVRWLGEGYRAVDGRVFDVGVTSQRAIERLRAGTPAAQSGGLTSMDNGNGSLMRVLPLALWHRGSDEQLVADSRRSSLPTHAHLRAQLCCAFYCLWARALLRGEVDGWGTAVTWMRGRYAEGSAEREELEGEILSYPVERVGGGGYVVDSLHSTRLALEQRSYEDAVKAAIALGRDTDTTACITGGLAGIRWGLAAIPSRWRSVLRGQEDFRADLDALLGQASREDARP